MKITKFHTGIALTTSLLLAALTGCGAANTASSSASGSASSSVSASASSQNSKKHTSFFVKDNGDGTKVIKDIDGKEVTVPTTPSASLTCGTQTTRWFCCSAALRSWCPPRLT